MAKIILMILALVFCAFVVVVMYCAMVVAGRSDDMGRGRHNNEGANKLFREKQICPQCKTGRDSYLLDEHSESCPYIGCWKNGKCPFYEPMEKASKTGLFKKNKDKTTVTRSQKF